MMMSYLRGLLMTLFMLVVLALGALEVVESHSVRASQPMRTGPGLPIQGPEIPQAR